MSAPPASTLASAAAALDYADGRGTATLTAAGTAGVPFTLALDGHGGGDHFDLGGSGTVDGKRAAARPPRRRSTGPPASGGSPRSCCSPPTAASSSPAATATGLAARRVRADALGLSLLTLADPAFNFGGHASGTLALALPAAGPPTGSLALRVTGLTRAGLAASSVPVDSASTPR